MNRDSREIRSMECEVRAAPMEGGQGLTFSGFAARYGTLSENLGGFVETLAQGVFAPVIGRDDVRCLVNHDPNQVLGRMQSGTLQLEDRPEGLFFIAQAPETQWARDFAESVRRGDVNQCSFCFACSLDDWAETAEGVPLRTVRALKLFDVSIVTYPAYQETDAAVRSARSVLSERKTLMEQEALRVRRENLNRRRKIEILEKEIL